MSLKLFDDTEEFEYVPPKENDRRGRFNRRKKGNETQKKLRDLANSEQGGILGNEGYSKIDIIYNFNITLTIIVSILLILQITTLVVLAIMAYELYSEESVVLNTVDDKIHTVFDIALCSIENACNQIAPTFYYDLGLDFRGFCSDIGKSTDICIDGLSSTNIDSTLGSIISSSLVDD